MERDLYLQIQLVKMYFKVKIKDRFTVAFLFIISRSSLLQCHHYIFLIVLLLIFITNLIFVLV